MPAHIHGLQTKNEKRKRKNPHIYIRIFYHIRLRAYTVCPHCWCMCPRVRLLPLPLWLCVIHTSYIHLFPSSFIVSVPPFTVRIYTFRIIVYKITESFFLISIFIFFFLRRCCVTATSELHVHNFHRRDSECWKRTPSVISFFVSSLFDKYAYSVVHL